MQSKRLQEGGADLIETILLCLDTACMYTWHDKMTLCVCITHIFIVYRDSY